MSGHSSAQVHDVDRVNESVVLVGHIRFPDRVTMLNTTTDEVVWRWNVSDACDPDTGQPTTGPDGEWRQSWVWRDDQLQWPRDADRRARGSTLVVDSHGNRILLVALVPNIALHGALFLLPNWVSPTAGVLTVLAGVAVALWLVVELNVLAVAGVRR